MERWNEIWLPTENKGTVYIKYTKGKYSFSISLVLIKVELVKTFNVNIRVIKIIYSVLFFIFVIRKWINQYSLVTVYVSFLR